MSGIVAQQRTHDARVCSSSASLDLVANGPLVQQKRTGCVDD
jgi:hypothetical protein